MIQRHGSQELLLAEEPSQQHSTQRSYDSDITVMDNSDTISVGSGISKSGTFGGREETRKEPGSAENGQSCLPLVQSIESPRERPDTKRHTSETLDPEAMSDGIKPLETPDKIAPIQGSTDDTVSRSSKAQEFAGLIEADLAGPSLAENIDGSRVSKAYKYVRKRSYSSTDLKLKCTAIPRIRYKEASPEI